MGADPELIRSLESVVASEPANHTVRLHLAELLGTSGRTADALAHCTEVLRQVPNQAAALSLVARIAAGAAAPQESGPTPAEPVMSAPAGHADLDPSPGREDDVAEELDSFLEQVLTDADAGRITLDDVGGLEDVKRRLHAGFLAPYRNKKLRDMYGTSLRGGLLLYGPPGCGKTFLGRAVAGELGAHFVSVGLSEVLDMWLGNSEKNVHEIFELARRRAPTVLFFDEVDALGMKRSNLARSAGRNVVAQLLTELDGIGSANEGVFVLGATNQPWDLDPALRRPGRFDRTLLVVPPDRPARQAILNYHLRGRPVGADVNVARLADRSGGFSGADLRLVCEAGAQRALEASLELAEPRPITMGDLTAALKEGRPTTRSWFEMARNFVLYANGDGTYDDLLRYMRSERLL